MEGLKKLEEIQSMLMLLDSQSFVSPFSSSLHSDSNRFLAHFLLFLMEPCGKLDIDHKCAVISQHLPKISSSFLEKALVVFPEKQMGIMGDSMSVNLVKENTNDGSHGLGMCPAQEDMALIGLDATQRANSTLEDFVNNLWNFLIHLDTLNEKMVDVTTSKATVQDGRSGEEANIASISGLNKVFDTDPFQPLMLLLQSHGLLTDREELNFGEEYWALERRLCGASGQVEILTEDVLRAIHLKSFDYQVLNLLLYQLRGEEVDDLHMEFLTLSEFLVEISDDLFDYEEDVLENNFNILRMFMKIYGASAAPSMLAKSITKAEQKYEALSKALDPQLSSSYHKRCEEATREGGKVSGYSLGSWTIPPLILDEELYISTMQEYLLRTRVELRCVQVQPLQVCYFLPIKPLQDIALDL